MAAKRMDDKLWADMKMGTGQFHFMSKALPAAIAEADRARHIEQVQASMLAEQAKVIKALTDALSECRAFAQTFAMMTTNERSACKAHAAVAAGAAALGMAERLP